MAEKSRSHKRPSQRRRAAQAPKRRQSKWVLGVVMVALVLGVGVMVRVLSQRTIEPRLQGAIDGHYTRGTADAIVTVKEFSDYT